MRVVLMKKIEPLLAEGLRRNIRGTKYANGTDIHMIPSKWFGRKALFPICDPLRPE